MNIIVARTRNMGIGMKNKIPWRLKGDMEYFKNQTIGNGQNCVIMGKNTWLSLPKKPLQKRENLILSSSLQSKDISGGHCFNNIPSLIEYVNKTKYENIWVIGGEQIYRNFLELNLVDKIYLTNIKSDIKCDTFFPKIPKNFKKEWVSQQYIENDLRYYYSIYQKVNNNTLTNIYPADLNFKMETIN